MQQILNSQKQGALATGRETLSVIKMQIITVQGKTVRAQIWIK